MIAKKQLRQNTKKYWKHLSFKQRQAYQKDLMAQLLALPEWQEAKVIAITLPIGGEIDTQPIIDAAKSSNKVIVIPKTLPGKQMVFGILTDKKALKKSAYGILEPGEDAQWVAKETIDLLVVPGLRFARNGQRLGHGGGYYDRYLVDFTGQTVSLAFPEMFVDEPDWEVTTYDLPVNKVLVAKEDEIK
ncbi:5-formyltetrahydrofolate cyclo-ligase [Aerococcus suis]|uniref:5-formyltetrahydrofolate cyclo-ligase n=1 Tax=Aerococcus suis TaxID=371602 RepID=A0A1W1Y233_9LACT|nr:5-formyltetrahydrofolate cyclo-ligase [Aerococcus suis]MCI7240563.1 5-formyltetrahydrofolate cyclo-ligase [Aerococcus suis]MDD7757970.1 5-formyltetrahydrofolate cyclo-ligase [Aerococcus suis]MDY4647188.1 5-formyltetrahydrofolate cyclo-ligase [Aerococcus suis]SMC30249.1 5-formyltetrahydrofolate cyclo-ligase [Aerococcus suis]